MSFRSASRIVLGVLTALLAPRVAAADTILFINWARTSGQYDGEDTYQVLVDMGHTVDLVDGPSDGAVAEDDGGETKGGCGCASTPRPVGWLAGLALLVLVGRRRR